MIQHKEILFQDLLRLQILKFFALTEFYYYAGKLPIRVLRLI